MSSSPNPKHVESFSEFASRIEAEFVIGSAISEAQFNRSIRIVSDTEQSLAGDVSYPIHEALNWHVTRFGHQARKTMYAALLLNEDGSTWQAKLSNPRHDQKKNQSQKYETPVGNGSRAYLPDVSQEVRKAVSIRYGVEVPSEGSFWDWVEATPQIPILPTEGGKKGLAASSQGYVAIALTGVNGGYTTKDNEGNKIDPQLIPDLQRFAVPGREFILAFDQDAKPETRRRVGRALATLGALLEKPGSTVRVAQWDGEQGKTKGLDDLIVHRGASAFEQACADALPLEQWKIWQRLENRLTYKSYIGLTIPDLSTLQLSDLPQEGIIAIASAKGTGKTKFIGNQTGGSEKVLLAGHRIALLRNLCSRLGVDYKGDLDKAKGQFINGEGYTLRVGFCVDSLLGIDPAKFLGCDLVIDEVCQVLRHLLTSSTCRKGGKLPALLARFRELVKVSRRVIVADADLDNASLDLLKELRGNDCKPFLIRNDYKPQGYPVRFINSKDSSVIVSELLKDVANGEKLFIVTDSKAGSKTLARLVGQIEKANRKVLLLNSETSGGECEQLFITNPDSCLDLYDVVIASPSLATGVSIERSHFTKIYALFYGVSSVDADMAQALARVRQDVPRVVWCRERGNNFCSISNTTNPLLLRSQLKERTDVEMMLLRSQLREDIAGNFSEYDWQNNPYLRLWSQIEAARNRSMFSLRASLLTRLKHEGNQITVEDFESNEAVKLLLKTTREEIRYLDAGAIANAKELTFSEVEALQLQEVVSPEDQLAIARFYIQDFYLTAVTQSLVLEDQGGRRRGELLNLEGQLYEGLAAERDIRYLEKVATWNQGICPWDVGTAELRRQVRAKLKLEDFLDPSKEWTAEDLKPYADSARENVSAVKLGLNFNITDKVSDTQIVHQLLRQMGAKVVSRWTRSHPGRKGEKIRVYRLDETTWLESMEILDRRRLKRETLSQQESQVGSPPPNDSINNSLDRGDPGETHIPKPEKSSPPPPRWGIGLVNLGSPVECLGKAGVWRVKYSTGVAASITDCYGREELVSCQHLRLVEVAA